MNMSNQNCVDRKKLLWVRDACTREKVSFQIGFEDSVRVGRSEIIREELLQNNRYKNITDVS